MAKLTGMPTQKNNISIFNQEISSYPSVKTKPTGWYFHQ